MRCILISFLMIFTLCAWADAPLKTALKLDVEQAKQVQQIQQKYRKEFRAKRQVFNTESRKLRRAKLDNDAQLMIAQQQLVDGLEQELAAIKKAEAEAISLLLTEAQLALYKDILDQQEQMVGSSRDVKLQ